MKAFSGREFARLLEGHGWPLLRVKGSHHVYGKTGEPARLSVPILELSL
jgi:predicted RNA binding protein YcfA (HicA-like mRNA interferase family)